MRFVPSLALATGLALTPVLAHADSIRTHWEQYKAGRAFRHLSVDGQKALGDIFKAHDLLAAGNTDAAIPALYDASKRLEAADKAGVKFNAAESALHTAPQHAPTAGHAPSAAPTDWVPVGGEFIVSDTLAPEKKASVASANAQLKAGQTEQAAQTMQVVGEDATFIVALAPLAATQGAVNRATVFTEGRQAKDALAALDDALNGLVFVTEDFAATALPAPKADAKTSK